ncbi:inositol-tetrakisphosphate 1-kinase [Cunninghamella echinulata]|nr:inositol-tetrakisphosphate 1-kinase [Cunninghamella echinulata]
MVDYLSSCINPFNPLFSLPKNKIIQSIKEYPDISHQLTYPIICKRQTACSSTKSHEMTLIPSINQLEWMTHYEDYEPLLLQEFIQHDGIIIKVYVADHQIYTSIRPSFMNMNQDGYAVHFDSQHLPKQFNHDKIIDPHLNKLISPSSFENQQVQEKKESQLDHRRLQEIANLLQQKLGLTFFGFDVLIESNTNAYFIVDVNYFPSFKNVPNFQDIFIDIIKKKLNL